MSRVLREFRRGLEQAKASRIEPCLPSLARPPSVRSGNHRQWGGTLAVRASA